MNAPSFTEHVVTTLSDGVAHIELARPDKLNSLSRPMLDALVETLRWAGVNPEVRAILISGHGRIFCAGDDLDGLGDLHGAPQNDLSEIYEAVAPVAVKMLTIRKPIVAAIHGGAYGAGLDLALTADYRVASERTKLGMVPAKLASAGQMALLLLYVSVNTARRLLFKAEPVSGSQALELGLVDELVDEDLILSRAREVAMELAKGPTLAYGTMKMGLLTMVGMNTLAALNMELDLSLASHGTHDAEEGMAAQMERREPRFLGR